MAGTRNLYFKLMASGYNRARLPIVIRISVGDEREYYLLTDTYGKGLTIFLAELVFEGDFLVFKVQIGRGAGMNRLGVTESSEPCDSTMQQILRHVITSNAAETGASPLSYCVFRCSVYRHAGVNVNGKLGYQLIEGPGLRLDWVISLRDSTSTFAEKGSA